MSDPVSRRAFLAASGSLALAAHPANAANERIAIGMIGVGSRAQQLLEDLKKISGVEIVAVCDAYRGRLERAVERTSGRAKIISDYRQVLADPSIDAVTIASPDHWHARQSIQALEAGKDVYCEKPLTYSIREGVSIARAVRKSGKLLQVGSQGISSPLQQQAREMIRSGKLGKVTLIRASYNRNSASGAWIYPIPPDASPDTVNWKKFLGSAPNRPFDLKRFFRWRCYKDYSGGIATDLFVHLCTTIHYLMDAMAPREVMAMGDLYRWGDSRDVPDTLNALLRYREGFTVNLSSTFNNRSQGGAGFEILGTEGTLRIGSGSVTFSRERLSENNDWIVEAWPTALEQQYRASLEPPDRTRPPEPEVIKAKGRGDTLLHLESFMHSVRTREPVVEDVWKGHRAAACAHMINSSAERGALVRWDFEQEERQV